MKTARMWFSLVAIFALAGGVRSQTLVTECVHRDSTGHVIYLENEYEDADTMLYYLVYSDGARLLKQWSQLRGDTVIEVSRCHEVIQRDYQRPDADEWMISESPDSIWYEARSMSEAVWDTALTKEEGEKFWILKDRLNADRAALVYEGEVPIELDRAIVRETWEYRIVQGVLIDKRIQNRNGIVSNRQHFEYGSNVLVALSYFDNDTAAYAVDSISWDVDTSAIKVVNRWLDNGERFEYTVQFMGDSSVFSSGGETVVDHWVYDRTPWNVRLREAALREGPLCQSRIRRAGECLLKASIASTGKYSISEHQRQTDGRLLETVVTRNGRFERRISYSYP